MGGRGHFGLLCQHFSPELVSTGMHMTELATRLHRLGWEITVICAQPSLSLESTNQRVPRRAIHDGVRVRRVWAVGSHRNLVSRALLASTFLWSSLVEVIRSRRDLDGLVVTTNPPFLGLVGRLAAALLRIPYVVIVYDVYPDLAGRLGVIKQNGVTYRVWNSLTRFFLRGAARLIVIGDDMRALVAAKLGAEAPPMELIRNWSDESHVAPVDDDENTFLGEHGGGEVFLVQYSGRMARTHNIEPVLEAAALLVDEPVRFQFIGDGAKKATLRARAAELGLDNVEFLPYQPRAILDQVLSAPDLAVVCLDPLFTGVSVPSKTYGVMAAGTPLLAIVDPSSEIGMTVKEHDCGVVLDDPSPQDVADAIRALVSDPERSAALGANARSAFLSHFTLAGAAAAYDGVLAEVFDQP